MTGEETYSISELVREFGVTARTIRYYEDQGLLSPTRAGQVRVYSKRDRARLKLSLRGKRLGLSLSQIREMIDLYDTAPDESAQLYKFLVALNKRKSQLEQQREDIEATLAEIDAFERQCRELLDRSTKPKAARSRRAARERSTA